MRADTMDTDCYEPSKAGAPASLEQLGPPIDSATKNVMLSAHISFDPSIVRLQIHMNPAIR